MSSFSAKEILEFIGISTEYVGNLNSYVNNAKPINSAESNSISFISSERKDKLQLLKESKAGIVIVDIQSKEKLDASKNQVLFFVNNPRLKFIEILERFFVNKESAKIHPSAIIHKSAIIGENVSIGPRTILGKVEIGDNTIIHGNCYIFDNVKIGSNVLIWPGAIIGSDGFGYIKTESEEILNFPHIGGVVIEDHVHIGANTCIDRGSLGDTIIKKNVKIDNLVHIAHNCHIGEGTFVIANAMIGGSTFIGKNSWVAPSSSIRDAIIVGENTVIGMASVVTKSIIPNNVVTGNPARPLKDIKRINDYLNSIVNKADS